MIYLKKIDEKFLINADRRTKRFNEKYGRKTAQEDVVMPQQTIDALSEGELVRGAVFVDECGTVRFTPYDIGGGLKLGPRKPEPVTTTPDKPAGEPDTPAAGAETAVVRKAALDITLRHIIVPEGRCMADADTPSGDGGGDVTGFLNQLYHYAGGGAANGDRVC